MIPTVRMSFDLDAAGVGDFFTIGDPVKGILGSGGVQLLGDVPVDVSEYVRSINIRRGRSKETDKVDAGHCTILLDNRYRTFDPQNTGLFVFDQVDCFFDDPQWTFDDYGYASPYAVSMVPRKAISIDLEGQMLFTGQMEDFDLDYSLNRDSTCTVKGSDGFTLLSGQQLTPGVQTTEDTGARMESVLDDPKVNWPKARRQIDTGISTMGADTVATNTNALRYIQDVNAGEPGLVFIGKDGLFRFRNRRSLQTDTGVLFSDVEGAGIPFRAVSRQVGTELLWTQINVQWLSGTVTEDNLTSQEKYGIEALNWKTFLSASAAADSLAQFFSRRYSEPTARINGIEITLDQLTAEEKGQVLQIELGDLVTVQFTPNQWGNPIEQSLGVEAIEHTITPTVHRVRFNLASGLAGFLIGDSFLGEEAVGF